MRTSVLKAIRREFTEKDRDVLIMVPLGAKGLEVLSKKYGLSEAALKARHKKLLRRLRRHVTAGEFIKYKEAVLKKT